MPKTITSPVSRFPGNVVLKDPIPLSACVEWERALADCQQSPCVAGAKILSHLWRDLPKWQETDTDEMRKQVEDELRKRVMGEYTDHVIDCKDCRPALSDTAAQERMLKAIRPCVEKWDIPAFDLKDPPGSPKVARSKFVAWIIGEISAIYNETEPDGDPNA